MLKLFEFNHSHHPSGVKLLAKFISYGISVNINFRILYDTIFPFYQLGRSEI